MQHVELHAHVDELVRKQTFIIVGKLGFRLQRAGAGVDLIVETRQRAARELVLLRAIERVHGELVARVQFLEHAGQDCLRGS